MLRPARASSQLDAAGRQRWRQQHARPVADHLREWFTLQRQKVPDGSAIAKAINYSLGRWQALTRYIDDGDLPIDNNWVENRIRPISVGRKNWLFAGSLRAGQRAAVIMSLIQSAKLCGHEPYRYLRDVLERLPTQPASRIEEPPASPLAANVGRGHPSQLEFAVKVGCPGAYRSRLGTARVTRSTHSRSATQRDT